MKLLSLAAVAFLSSAQIVSASGLNTSSVDNYVEVVPTNQPLSYVGYAEYAEATSEFRTSIGARYSVDNWVLGGDLLASGTSSTFNFTGVNLGVAYAISPATVTYLQVSFDKDFDYSNAVLGLAFRF